MANNHEIKLSGGEFGGTVCAIADGSSAEIEMTDDAGNLWIYDCGVSDIADQAQFREFVPAARVGEWRAAREAAK